MVEAGQDWRTGAACRAGDPEMFFPVAEHGPQLARQVAAAKAVCAGCPVIEPCRAWAIESLPLGVAGGLTEAERRAQRAATNRRRGQDQVQTGQVEPPVGGNRREFAAAGRRAVAAGEAVSSVARRFGVDERTAYHWRAAVTAAAMSAGGAR